MHSLIRVIVYAGTNGEALSKAKKTLNYLCGEEKTFDYYVTFEGKESILSGAGRWGEMECASKVESDNGRKLIQDAMDIYREETIESLQKIRKLLSEKTNLEITKGDSFERYYFGLVGRYKGYPIILYDKDGEGIISETHLNDSLTNYQENTIPYEVEGVWIVPADVHY